MEELLSFLDGFKKEITLVYGKAGSGKTTLALQAAVNLMKEKHKVLFLDTENGFSAERLKQMCGNEYQSITDNLVIIKIKDFAEQYKKITDFVGVAGKFKLVIVDTLGNLYRNEVKKDFMKANTLMDRQLRMLFEMSRKVPVLLSNQVYSNMENDGVVSVGGNMVMKWCNKIIELEREPRKIKLIKPEEKIKSFGIADSGIVLK